MIFRGTCIVGYLLLAKLTVTWLQLYRTKITVVLIFSSWQKSIFHKMSNYSFREHGLLSRGGELLSLGEINAAVYSYLKYHVCYWLV